MINRLLFLTVIFLITAFFQNYSYSAGEDWRSRVSGNWNTPGTWEFSTNNGASWSTATSSFPDITSDEVEVRSSHNVTIPVSVSLAVDQLTIRTGGTLTVNSGAILTINDGSGTDLLMESSSSLVGNGGMVKNSGTSVVMIIRNATVFSAALKIDSATVTMYNDGSPFTSIIKGVLQIDSNATLVTASGGYTIQTDSTVRNLGTISAGSGSRFRVNGYSFKNFGTINISILEFNDSTSVIADTTGKNGKFQSPNITFTNLSRVKHMGSKWTIGPSATSVSVNSGGKLDVSAAEFILDGSGGAIDITISNLGTVLGSGPGYPFICQSNVSVIPQTGSTFSSPLKIKSGTTYFYSNNSPFNAIINSPLIIDTGAVLHAQNGGYTLTANSTVINNGTITGGSGANFSMRGSSITNNGTVNSSNFTFDDTVTFVNTGSWIPSSTSIRNGGSAVLGNNLSIGTTAGISFYINGGGVLNLNGLNMTVDGTTGADYVEINANGYIKGAGFFMTKGSVSVNVQTSSFFNSQLKVLPGTSTVYSSNSPNTAIINSTITVDPGAVLHLNNGGYTLLANAAVVNNGMISGGSGAAFTMAGNVFNNYGNINCSNFYFSDTTTLVSTGLWSPQNSYVSANAIMSLGGDVRIGTTLPINFTIQPNGTVDLANFNLSVDSNSTTDEFVIQNNGILRGSGKFQPNGLANLNVQTGGKIFAPLKVLKGTSYAYCSNSPNVIYFDSTVTVDASAVFSLNNGGYAAILNNNLTNNGTITGGSGATLRFYGRYLVNNGIIGTSNFYFESAIFAPTSIHDLSGTGSFITNPVEIVQGANVGLLSSHTFFNLLVNSGGLLDLNSQTIKFTGNGVPLTVNGTILATGATIEYKGTASQTITSTNISHHNITINNPVGTILSGNLSYTGVLSLISGDLDLSGNIITLLSNASLSESSGNTVKGNSGYISVTRNLTSPSAVNVAGLGATITSSAALGITEIRRGHAIQNLPGGNTSIRRYYAFNPYNNNSLNATITMKYDTSELNNQNERNLSLFKSTNGGSSYFPEPGVLDTVNNTYTQTQLASLNRSTFGTGTGFVKLTVTTEGLYNPSTLKMNARDTVRLILRNNASPYGIIDSSRGKLDSVNLTVSLAFANATTDTFYFAVRHRNSLETWSKAGGERFFTGDTAYFNFTASQTNSFGSNTILKGTKWCIYSGDITQDGIIEASDLSRIDNDAADFITGYVPTDLDGNYFVDGSDFAICDNNASNFISKITP